MTDIAPHHIARINEAHSRIGVVEGRVTALETDGKVSAERHKHIEKSLSSIESNLSKVVWLIIAAIVGALLSLLFKGGLNV